jgi:hypothetical protein
MRPGQESKEQAMASNTEKELGLEDVGQRGDPEPDRPGNPWTATVDALADRRQENEIAALAAAFNPAARTPASALRIANDMQSRSRFLRSKQSSRGSTKKLERQIVEELDVIEALARELNAQERSGTLGKGELAAGRTHLDLAVFAVRGRFENLMARQSLSYGPQARPQDPAARQRELDDIEAFLAHKNRREVA